MNRLSKFFVLLWEVLWDALLEVLIMIWSVLPVFLAFLFSALLIGYVTQDLVGMYPEKNIFELGLGIIAVIAFVSVIAGIILYGSWVIVWKLINLWQATKN
jgi:hypothetical protein